MNAADGVVDEVALGVGVDQAAILARSVLVAAHVVVGVTLRVDGIVHEVAVREPAFHLGEGRDGLVHLSGAKISSADKILRLSSKARARIAHQQLVKGTYRGLVLFGPQIASADLKLRFGRRRAVGAIGQKAAIGSNGAVVLFEVEERISGAQKGVGANTRIHAVCGGFQEVFGRTIKPLQLHFGPGSAI